MSIGSLVRAGKILGVGGKAYEFTPSAYSGNKSATTNVSGQSLPLATGAVKIRIKNLDSTNFTTVAFGESAAAAEANTADGLVVFAGEEITLGIPDGATHLAYVGNTATVLLNIVQGV